MKRVAFTIAALVLGFGVAQAEPLNAEANGSGAKNGKTVGATGALGNVNANGVATDPQGVAEQSKGNGAVNSSAGTVGAAPGADVPSSSPKH